LGSDIDGRRSRPGDPSLHASGQLTARQQNAATAGLALQANVRAQANHPPVGPAAGMRFAQPHHVLHLQIVEHGGVPPDRLAKYTSPAEGLSKAGCYNAAAMFGDLPTFISAAITLVIAFSVHEFAHAWAADRLGDDTPRLNGRLTLNPRVHLDVLGTLMLLFAGFGWAKPVPINPVALRRRGVMLVAAAGPLSNLLLALLAALPFQADVLQRTGPATRLLPSLSSFLQLFIFVNLILLLFNLIPISPLDGEKVLSYFLPPDGQETMYRLRPYGPMILMGLILLARFGQFDLLGLLIRTPANRLFSLLVA